MKVFASTLFLFLLAGCSPEELSMNASDDAGNHYKKSGSQEPLNPANSSDHAGVVYGELLDAYYLQPTAEHSLQQTIEQGEALAFNNPGFLLLSGHVPYIPLEAQDVEPYLLADPESLEDFLSAAYSDNAIAYLSDIAINLQNLKDSNAPYQDVYSFLVATESAISSDHQLTGQERDALLTTASIIRTALHYDTKRKRRDRDWEMMTSNFTATANAAMDSQQQAIIMSFVTDVPFD